MKKYKSVKVKTKCGDIIELHDSSVTAADTFFAVEGVKVSYVFMLDSVVWVRKQEY